MLRFRDKLIQFLFPRRAVHRQLDRLINQRRIKKNISEFDGTQTIRAVRDEWRAIEDRIDEILHQGRVRIRSVLDGNINVPDVGFGKAALRRFAELDHVGIVAGELQLVVFEDQPSARSVQFETVASRRFTSGRNENPGAAIGPFHVGRDIIFDLNIVIPAELTKPAHTRWHPAEPLEHVELVQALIQQHTAALAFPGRAPAAARVISFCPIPIGNNPVHADQLAEFAALNEFADFHVARFDAQLEHAREYLFGIFFVCGKQTFGIGLVRGNGLLDHDMKAVVQGVDADGRVQVMRRGNDDSVNRAGPDHLFTSVESLELFVLLERFEAGRVSIADRGQFATRDFFVEQIACVKFANIAQTDDAETDLFHVRIVCFCSCSRTARAEYRRERKIRASSKGICPCVVPEEPCENGRRLAPAFSETKFRALRP